MCNKKNHRVVFLFVSLILLSTVFVPAAESVASKKKSGNPIFPGWYGDPEVILYGDTYWIFPTCSEHYEQQTRFDGFSSRDLVNWQKHEKILSSDDISWARCAMWAPSVLEKDGKYYFFFSANDVKEGELGGIGVAVSDQPQGPYRDFLGKPLLNGIINGAQPIDQYVFKDDDDAYYMIYGGWGHCNIVRLNNDFTGLLPLPDGTYFKEITPEGYTEGPCVFKRNGKYYFMWSEGGWILNDYCAAYAVSDSLFGPHQRIGKILEPDTKVGMGAGHHSVLQVPGIDKWYVVYHRRPVNDNEGNHRETCIDVMEFDDQGFIKPVRLTFEGVSPQMVPQNEPTGFPL